MLEQNRKTFDLLGITQYHKAGMFGQGNKIDVILDDVKQSGHANKIMSLAQEVAPLAPVKYLNRLKMKESVDWIFEHKDEIASINCSWHGYGTMTDFERLEALDISVFAASGNQAKDRINYPARLPWVFTVGGWDPEKDKKTGYSNWGEGLDCLIPDNIYWLSGKGEPMTDSGTSFCCPVVPRMLRLTGRDYTRQEAYDFVRTNCADVLDEGWDKKSGHGIFVLPDLEVDVMLPIKLGRISQEYGRKNTAYVKGYHTGIDFVAGENDKYIYSIKPGIAIKARCAGGKGADPNGWGNYVIVRQYDGYDTIYAHLSQVLVQEGEAVSVRTILGIQGSTGNSTGPHLHFEVREQPWGSRNDTNAADYLSIVNKVGYIQKMEVIDLGRFKDVDDKKWYAASVERAAELGLMAGISEDKFDPDKTLTRAELATVAVRIYDKLKS